MVTIIAAIGKNNELGKDNSLIWHLPADLKRFKKLTTGHTIIMGRNTYESIGRPLPNRRSIIITRNRQYSQEGCEVVHSLAKAINLGKDEKVFIIGGTQIYKQALEENLVDVLDITQVHSSFEADVFFPSFDFNNWRLENQEDFEPDGKNKFFYSFLRYVKVS